MTSLSFFSFENSLLYPTFKGATAIMQLYLRTLISFDNIDALVFFHNLCTSILYPLLLSLLFSW